MSQVPNYQTPQKQDDLITTMIPKNTSALISYYMGIFAFVPLLGMVLGIIAVVFGIKGLKYAAVNPQAKGQIHAWVGIILGGLLALMWLSCGGFMIFGMIMAGSAHR